MLSKSTIRGLERFRARSYEASLKEVSEALFEVQETLEAGLIPREAQWKRIAKLTPPWGSLSSQCLQDLRSRGAPIVPTLLRLRELVLSTKRFRDEIQTKVAQAWAQALLCLSLVPLLSFALYFLLPALAEKPWLWGMVTTIAFLWNALGCYWLWNLSQYALWGGLASHQRPWVVSSQCAGERLLALIRSGLTTDLAWSQAHQFLTTQNSDLASIWGACIWREAQGKIEWNGIARLIGEMANSLRKAIHVSLMDGKPCTEKIETILAANRADIQNQIERGISVLPVQALKPLFFFVGPSLLGMLLGALYLSWVQVSRGGF